MSIEALKGLETLMRALAKRTETVLSKQSDPQEAMQEIEAEAKSNSLLHEAADLTKDSPQMFAQHLWVDNPAALDWLNIRQADHRLRNPLTISELPDLLDLLGS